MQSSDPSLISVHKYISFLFEARSLSNNKEMKELTHCFISETRKEKKKDFLIGPFVSIFFSNNTKLQFKFDEELHWALLTGELWMIKTDLD